MSCRSKILTSRQASSTTAAEATLNWQSENVVAQNQSLKAILIQQKNLSKNQEALAGRVHTVESIINDVRSKIQELHHELLQMVRSTPVSHASNALTNKEAEMKFLKAQLVDLERQHKQQRRSTVNDDPWRLPTTPFAKPAFDPQPLPLQSLPKPTPSLTLWASEQDKLKNKALFLPPSQANIASTSNTESSFEDSSLIASSKAPEVLLIEGINPIFMFLQALTQQSPPKVFPCVPDSKSSLPDEQDFSKDFEHLFLAEPEPTVKNTFDFDYDAEEAASVATPKGKKKFPRSYAKQKFTFDDIPPSKWRERSIEMPTWCSAELQFYDIDIVIKSFLTRCQGRLRDWYLSLGEYRQL
ncbi:hypothetical protein R6Q57_012894 [Mikania cordata]